MPMKKLQLQGQVFSDWTVLEFAGTRASDNKTLWRVRCACAAHTEKIVTGADLRSGGLGACGKDV
jgi:hypothetical protein